MPSSSHGPSASVFLLAAVGAVGVVCLLVIGLVAVLGGDDGSAGEDARLEATTSSLAPDGAPTPIPVDTVAPATDAPATSPDVTAAPVATDAAATTAPDTTATETTAPETTAPATTVPATTVPATTVPVEAPADVPESKAVVRNGQIFLEGAVPTAEAGAAIEALAAEILGPDNVFNNYVVDERAGDPNLGNITVEDTINFATGSAEILSDGELLLNQGLALLTIRPAMTIEIVGHTDDRGSDEYNLDLSQRRADSVKTWFTDRGVDGNRLTAIGAGESDPIADNGTPDGRRLNRRIQFFLENILGEG